MRCWYWDKKSDVTSVVLSFYWGCAAVMGELADGVASAFYALPLPRNRERNGQLLVLFRDLAGEEFRMTGAPGIHYWDVRERLAEWSTDEVRQRFRVLRFRGLVREEEDHTWRVA